MDFEDHHFITLEPLALVVEFPRDSDPIIHYDKMKSEYVSRLWAFPTIVTYALAAIFDRERATLLLERGKEADQNDDDKTLENVLNEFLDKSKFLECPLFPPADENLLFADLIIGMATYILLGKALSQHLENGQTSQTVEWSDRISLETIKPGERFDLAVTLMWLGKMINLASVRLNGAIECANAGEEDAPWVPLLVETYFLKDEGKEILRPYFHRVGLHPRDVEGEPNGYELWIVFQENETEYYSIAFEFKPLWKIHETTYAEKLFDLLLMIEHDVRHIFHKMCGRWEHFVNRLEDYVSKNEESGINMLNKFLSLDHLVHTSCDYHNLRRSIGSLDWNSEDKYKFEEFSRKYQKYFRNKYVSPDMLDALRNAMPAIRKLWSKIVEDKGFFDEDIIYNYVKENAETFFFATPDHIAKHGYKYHQNMETSGESNFIIDSLVTVSARKGHQLTRTVIKQLLDAKMI